MRPEYYADEYRRYQTFCRNFSGNELFKIACGPNADDYGWTETIMQLIKPWHTGAISMHYYTAPDPSDWDHKGSATDFTETEYYNTIANSLRIEELIEKHGEIMDKYDPEGKIKLIVDEWGCWYDVEPGTNPAFLYQQNTMRDAIVAASSLNIFNNHCDRVMMANIAQIVNVLQSVILTDGDRMVKTPTYYVFKMFVPHQGAELVPVSVENNSIISERNIPQVNCSASKGADGKLFVTLANCSLTEAATAELNAAASAVKAQIISSEKVSDYNDFGEDEKVTLKDYNGFEVKDNAVRVELPPCSVVSLEIV